MLKKITIFAWLITCFNAYGQSDYKNYTALSNSLCQINNNYKNLSTLKSIGKSVQGRDIWLLTFTKAGKPEEKPAILIAAGLDAHHLAGVESSIQIAEKILQNVSKDSVSKVLETKTIYIVPCVNPDAYGQAFAKTKYERNLNASNADKDRDGRLNGFEDLNNDGLITLVRIEDLTGNFTNHKDDARILVKADATKGETGKYIVLSEGIIKTSLKT